MTLSVRNVSNQQEWVKGSGGAAHVLSMQAPPGTWVSEVEITLTAIDGTDETTLTLANAAKALRITVTKTSVTDGSDTAAALLVCFDPPSDAVRDAWLDTTQVGPRMKFLPGTTTVVNFTSAVTSLGLLAKGTCTGAIVAIEAMS